MAFELKRNSIWPDKLWVRVPAMQDFHQCPRQTLLRYWNIAFTVNESIYIAPSYPCGDGNARSSWLLTVAQSIAHGGFYIDSSHEF
jgi:hypothetical protein